MQVLARTICLLLTSKANFAWIRIHQIAPIILQCTVSCIETGLQDEHVPSIREQWDEGVGDEIIQLARRQLARELE